MATPPPIDLSVRDNGQIQTLLRELRRINSPETKRRLYRGLNRATIPMRAKAKDEARRILPRSGGLNSRVATKIPLTTRGNNNGVYVTTSKSNSQGGLIDRGKVRHPVFGNRDVWRTTDVPSGWFTRPMEDGADEARRELVAVFDEVAREIARRTTS